MYYSQYIRLVVTDESTFSVNSLGMFTTEYKHNLVICWGFYTSESTTQNML